MYKEYTGIEYRKFFNLPGSYQIEGIISCGSWKHDEWKEIFENNMRDAAINFSLKQLDGFLDHIYEYTLNSKRYWLAITYGPVRLTEYLHLGCLFGSRKNVHIGSCGGLNKEMDAGEILVPTYSYDTGSVIEMYQRNNGQNVHSDSTLSEKLIKKAKTYDLEVHNGPIVTCLGMLGETWDDIDRWSQKGFFGVEMETAAVFSVSNHFKVPSAAIVYVTDNLIKKETVISDSYVAQAEIRIKAKKTVTHVAQKAVMDL